MDFYNSKKSTKFLQGPNCEYKEVHQKQNPPMLDFTQEKPAIWWTFLAKKVRQFWTVRKNWCNFCNNSQREREREIGQGLDRNLWQEVVKLKQGAEQIAEIGREVLIPLGGCLTEGSGKNLSKNFFGGRRGGGGSFIDRTKDWSLQNVSF